MSEGNLLEFPTDYPVKIMGRPSPEFRARGFRCGFPLVENLDES